MIFEPRFFGGQDCYREQRCREAPSWAGLELETSLASLSSARQQATSEIELLETANAAGLLPVANRILLGWTTTQPANGALLHRISHPLGLQQVYSSATVVQNPLPALTCGKNTNRFIATDPFGGDGATFGGSSGSAMVNAQLQVVGNLSAGCGPNVEEPCDGRLTDLEWDGRFSAYFQALAPFLSPTGGGGNTSPCQVANGVECLVGNRFELSASFQDQNGNSGPIRLIRYTDSSVLGHYGDASNIEILGKVLNGCPLNGQWWVFLAGVTDQGVEVRVRDTQTGRSYSYSNPLGRKYVTDTQTSAIPCQ